MALSPEEIQKYQKQFGLGGTTTTDQTNFDSQTQQPIDHSARMERLKKLTEPESALASVPGMGLAQTIAKPIAGIAKEAYKSVVRPLATPFAGFQAGITGKEVQYPDILGGARGSVEPEKQAKIAAGGALETAALIPGAGALSQAAKVGKAPLRTLAATSAAESALAGYMGAAGAALGEGASFKEAEKAGKYGGLVGLGLGSISPAIGNYLKLRTFKDVAPEAIKRDVEQATQKAVTAYRNVLKPTKGEYKKFEVVSGKDLDSAYELMAKEGISVGRTVDNKLDTADARAIVQDKIAESDAKLDEMLSQKPDVQHDLMTTRNSVLARIDQLELPAVERQAMKQDVDRILNAEIEERFGKDWQEKGIEPVVDNLTYNRIKQNMYQMGYDQMQPTKNKTARQIGRVIREDIEAKNPDAAIAEQNKKTGQYADALNILENAHGRVVKGGVMGRALASVTGAIAGQALSLPIPFVGPAVTTVLGSKVAETVAEKLADPTRITRIASERLQDALSRTTPEEIPTLLEAFAKMLREGKIPGVGGAEVQPKINVE